MRLRDILSLAAHNLRKVRCGRHFCALSVAVEAVHCCLSFPLVCMGENRWTSVCRHSASAALWVYTESGHAGTILSAALADEIEQDVDGIRTLMPIRRRAAPCASDTQLSTRYFGADERLGEVMQMEMLAGTLPNAWQANAEPVARGRR